MPVRLTKRGDARTPLTRDCDVLICGASFAGLAVARELAGSGADVLVVDRYEIGERQTSACGIPTSWLEAMGLMGSHRQTFGELVIHTPHGTSVMDLPWTFSTFDYRELCALLADQGDVRVRDRQGGRAQRQHRAHRPRGRDRAARGRRARLAPHTGTTATSRPTPRCRAGWRSTPTATGADLEIWIDRSYVPAGYAWSFPAADELRIGVGSFDPRFHVKDNTVKLARDLDSEAVRYQGNWIPHKLRHATEDGVFFAGDSAGHCLPLTAEGIRTAFYFGIACGRELRAVVEGRQPREQALRRYHDFSASHEWKFGWMLRTQRAVPRVPPRVLHRMLRGMRWKRFVDWSFGHYLNIAPPSFAGGGPSQKPRRSRSGRVTRPAPVRAR